MKAKKKRPAKSLASGRPPTVQRPKTISRKATKALINAHHLLEKRKAQAATNGDKSSEAAINAEIAALGGLDRYQQASLQGQRNDRGGDSSRVLMEWLKPLGTPTPPRRRLRMLEVGALSCANECSRSRLFDMERIDLNSQGEGILQQDFMLRPLPANDVERFDIISLSLVLNYVPDAAERGKMLLRTLDFLYAVDQGSSSELHHFFPSLFMVLPAPCVTNSRYMDEAHLESIMNAIGFSKVRSKVTQKLVYYLWTRVPDTDMPSVLVKKTELRSGRSRNNFAIILRGSSAL
jgi:25S rRNA (adenine2142-N1)-methyltransferase